MLKYLFLLTGLVASVPLAAQDTDWIQIGEFDGIRVYSSHSDCYFRDDFAAKRILLRFENTTEKPLSIEWDLKTWINGECTNCDNPTEPHFMVDLEPGQTRQGDCSIDAPAELYFFEDFILPERYKGHQTLTDFELTHVKVSIIK